jgi:hypothetical protein
MNKVIPAISMVYCKYVCGWRVCGSLLPGYLHQCAIAVNRNAGFMIVGRTQVL